MIPNQDQETVLELDAWIVGKHAIQLNSALLLAHFDGHLSGHAGQMPSVVGEVGFREGKYGQAVRMAEGATLSYPIALNPDEGSLLFWMADNALKRPMHVRAGGNALWEFNLDYYSGVSVYFGRRIHRVACPLDPAFNHIAFSWSRNPDRATLMINGRFIWSEPSYLSPTFEPNLLFSGFAGLDDLVVSDRYLTSETIEKIYHSGAPVFVETNTWKWPI
jgi:hypothetical protein